MAVRRRCSLTRSRLSSPALSFSAVAELSRQQQLCPLRVPGSRYSSFGREDTHLVVDVGYFTTDWLYATGFMIDDHCTGGMFDGTSQIYHRIAKLISRDEGEEVNNIALIDKALPEKLPFFFNGKNIDLAPYVEMAAPIIASDAMEMQNHIGRLPDVRSIILSGGGAALYAAAIRRAFPRVVIEKIDPPASQTRADS